MPNQLINQSSPYLLQHANNPVNWFPWGKEALSIAKKENKLIIVSIGYSACHWCHVMEHESFENVDIAELMNQHFVCIKVDREERPDIDHIYMTAVQLMNQNGGWPLNCITMPDGTPIFGGTYFRPEHWTDILNQIAQLYRLSPNRFEETARQLKSGINAMGNFISDTKPNPAIDKSIFDEIIPVWKNNFDYVNGGSKGAPKFPMPNNYSFLLSLFYHTKNKDLFNYFSLTLNKLAQGGIYDHLGGGFARYSVDEKWMIPHFEKMIYDNTQLLNLYSLAFKLTKKNNYQTISFEIIAFLNSELCSTNGAFYCALDADSEGKEGKYYCWTKQEIANELGNDTDLFCTYFQVTEHGNWDETNILHLKNDSEKYWEKFSISQEQFWEIIKNSKQKLLLKRETRIKPNLDNKILASWNGLAITAFCNAYNAFGEIQHLDIALKTANYIKENLLEIDGRLHRTITNSSKINGFLDDYALVTEAFIQLYQSSFDEKWLLLAKKITDYTIEHFFDEHSGFFFYTSNIDEPLSARIKEINDNVIPSSNSVMGKNLFLLSHFFSNPVYENISHKMVQQLQNQMTQNVSYYSNWAQLTTWFVFPFYEFTIIGAEAIEINRRLQKYYQPNVLFAGSLNDDSQIPILNNRFDEGKTLIYVCKDKHCFLPETNVDEVIEKYFNFPMYE